jgi:phosphopantetheinyl transferase (holo-ACP synthase)
MDPDGVVGEALELVAIAELEQLLAAGRGAGPFTPAERAYAESKSDPARRLAARLAAKRAACRALAGGVELEDIEVVRGLGGPPGLRLSLRASRRLEALGGARTLVSLTHGLTHAAAAVLLLGEGA